MRLITPDLTFPAHYRRMSLRGNATGNLAFDAQIAALCLSSGVTTLLTADRDFSRFDPLRTLCLEVA